MNIYAFYGMILGLDIDELQRLRSLLGVYIFIKHILRKRKINHLDW